MSCIVLAIVVLWVSAYDARQHWSGCVNEINDQGHCGSCFAWSAIEVLEDQHCISGRTSIHLDPEVALACGNLGGCNGGWPASVLRYHVSHPSPVSSCVRYSSYSCNEGASGADHGCVNCMNACDDGRAFVSPPSPKSVMEIKSETNFINALNRGTVSACFSVYENFYTFFRSNPTGILTSTSGNRLGGHCVKIIGYDQSNGVKYWTLANSWGTSFADRGFFKMQRGTNLAGIESSGSIVSFGSFSPFEEGFNGTLDETSQAGLVPPGGLVEQGLNGIDSSKLFNDAARAVLSSLHRTEPYVFERVRTQVVAGLNILLDLTIKPSAENPEPSFASAVVFHSLDGSFEVASVEVSARSFK